MKKWRSILIINLAAILLGALLTLAFAPYEIFPLAVLSPLGLLFLWQNVSRWRAFWLGFLFGIGFYGTGVYWVYISIHFFGDVPSFLASLITAALIADLALFPALTGYVANRFFAINHPVKLILACPAIWVFSEWIRSWLFSGFPWLFLGYSQTNSPLKGYAPLLSVYAVSLVVMVSSGLLLNAFLKIKQKNYYALYLSLFSLTALWITGALLDLIPWTRPQGVPLTVSLVQGNIPQSIKWSPDHLQFSLDTYEKLTQPLWGKSQLIIWPEAAIPLALQDAKSFLNAIDAKAKATKSTIMLGIPIKASQGDNYFNAIITLGEKHATYMKRHLVPFGEYTPFASLLTPLLDFMKIPMSDLIPGNFNQTLLDVNGVKIQTSICYEIGFPELIHINDPAIGFLLTVTNDAWFGKSAAQAQQFQMAIMRALELRRPVIAIGNDGISAVIGSDGKVEAAIPPYEANVLQSQVQPREGLTPWMRNGMDPLLVILLLFLFIAVREKKKSKQLIFSKEIIFSDNKHS